MRLTIATIASAVGLKGHVRLKVHTDDPAARFIVGNEVFTENGRLTISDVRSDGKSWQLKFSGHEDRNAAEALRDTRLFIDTDDEDEIENEFFYHELIGLPALDVAGNRLGTIKDVQAFPAQDLIVVETGNDGDVLVPFVDEIVPEVREDAVVMDPPGGLFDPTEAVISDGEQG